MSTDYLTVSVPQEFRYSQTECLQLKASWGYSHALSRDGSQMKAWWRWLVGDCFQVPHVAAGTPWFLVCASLQGLPKRPCGHTEPASVWGGSHSPQTFWVNWVVMVITSAVVLSFKTSHQLQKFWIETYEKKRNFFHTVTRDRSGILGPIFKF